MVGGHDAGSYYNEDNPDYGNYYNESDGTNYYDEYYDDELAQNGLDNAAKKRKAAKRSKTQDPPAKKSKK